MTDIEAELEGKNPKRVLGGLKKQNRIQKNRVKAYLQISIGSFLLVAVDFFFDFLPTFLQVICLFFLASAMFGFFMDLHIYRAQLKKINAIDEYLENSPEPS